MTAPLTPEERKFGGMEESERRVKDVMENEPAGGEYPFATTERGYILHNHDLRALLALVASLRAEVAAKDEALEIAAREIDRVHRLLETKDAEVAALTEQNAALVRELQSAVKAIHSPYHWSCERTYPTLLAAPSLLHEGDKPE